MFLLSALAALGSIASVARANETPKQPNIIFFIVDDLDARMTSPDVMPLTKKHMINQGTTYPRHYCTVSLCCPARASVLTGQNAHNHNVTDVSSPEGMFLLLITRKSQ
jgi:arylsulfatase A-like enzyme